MPTLVAKIVSGILALVVVVVAIIFIKETSVKDVKKLYEKGKDLLIKPGSDIELDRELRALELDKTAERLNTFRELRNKARDGIDDEADEAALLEVRGRILDDVQVYISGISPDTAERPTVLLHKLTARMDASIKSLAARRGRFAPGSIAETSLLPGLGSSMGGFCSKPY